MNHHRRSWAAAGADDRRDQGGFCEDQLEADVQAKRGREGRRRDLVRGQGARRGQGRFGDQEWALRSGARQTAVAFGECLDSNGLGDSMPQAAGTRLDQGCVKTVNPSLLPRRPYTLSWVCQAIATRASGPLSGSKRFAQSDCSRLLDLKDLKHLMNQAIISKI